MNRTYFPALQNKIFKTEDGTLKQGVIHESFFPESSDELITCLITYDKGMVSGERAISGDGYYETWNNGRFVNHVSFK